MSDTDDRQELSHSAEPSPIDRALDAERAVDAPAEVQGQGWRARIHTQQVGPVGVVVDRVRVEGVPGDITKRAQDLAERLRPQGERLDAVEVAPQLGGAVLRTRRDDIRRGRFFQVELDESGADLTRLRKDPGRGRRSEGFAVTREELGRIVEDMGDVLAPPPPDDD